MILAKICVLGDISVGKTSLIRRYVDREFSDAYLSTVGVKISRKFVKLAGVHDESPREIQMVLWDLEGGSTFHDVSESYLQGAHAAVIVGDLTRLDTIDRIENHLDHFLKVNPRAWAVVALNKSDALAEKPDLSSNSWDSRKAVIQTMCTSARSGGGVDRLFEEIGLHLISEHTDGPAR